MSIRILQGDCRLVMATLPECSIDAIVTDPPYELGFMGKGWDSTGVANDVETWRQCLRVLKPGGHLLAFSGTRTQHRMVCAIEDAGFEIRDQAGWMYGSGFPKSLDVSKAIDKHNGDARPVVGTERISNDIRGGALLDVAHGGVRPGFERDVTSAASAASAAWAGWGTALKPAWEPICVARKPLHGTVAANVLKHGTGALNIDGCRVDAEKPTGWGGAAGGSDDPTQSGGRNYRMREGEARPAEGRWPANLLHDGSPDVVALFPQSSSGHWPAERGSGGISTSGHAGQSGLNGRVASVGSAARFFWSPKTSASDRHEGLQHPGQQFQQGSTLRDAEKLPGKGNHHPTVKPTDLMRYLCRLVTPPGGTVLDPFMGSGSTLKAAELEGFSAIGIELSAEYIAIAQRRIGADAPLFASVEVA